MFKVADLPTRFASKISVSEETGCWNWTAAHDQHGYGRCAPSGGLSGLAHRAIYALLAGDPGQMLDHLCRNPPCVNPAHLEPVTNRENQLRGRGFVAANANKTECVKGHPFDEQNTYSRKNGGRDCRRCVAARQQASKQRRAA